MNDLIILAVSAAAIFVLAAIAQAVSGFGASMVSIPLLVLVVDPVTAVVSATGVSALLSGMAWHKEREHVDAPLARRLVVAGLFGIPLGLGVLLLVDEVVLTRVIGVTLAVTVVALAFRMRIPTSAGSQRAAGVLSGALLTSTGMNGPPVVLALQGTGDSARRQRATTQAVFTGQDIVAVAAFAVAGTISLEALLVVASGWVGMQFGWGIGDRIFHRISERGFRVVVLVGLAAAAVVCLFQGAGH